MGQRHQIYCRVKNPENFTQWCAYHNQWSYGTLPLKALKRILLYERAAANKLSDSLIITNNRYKVKLIEALLSVDPQEGFYSDYCDITEEVMEVEKRALTHVKSTPNPLRGDNNDGITVIDFEPQERKDKIKYCFMDIDRMESPYHNAVLYKPMSAKEYVMEYYQKDDKQWKFCKPLIDFIDESGAEVLSLDETMEMFPHMYAELMVERKKLIKTPKEQLPLLINDKFKYQLNRDFVLELLKKA